MILEEWEVHWIYDILVRECYASNDEDTRFEFVFHHTKEELPGEYRFVGALGMGGKFYLRHGFDGRQMHVDCYPNDRTPERDEMMRQANECLQAMPETDPLSVRVGAPKRGRRSSLAERAHAVSIHDTA